MREFRAAGVQIAQAELNSPERNTEKALRWLKKAADLGAELVVYPETYTTGFATGVSRERLWDLVDFIPGRTTEPVQKAAEEYGIYVVWNTYERGDKKGTVYNASVLIGREGEIAGTYRKTHLFPSERLDEGGWATPGEKADVFDTDLGKIGLMICYDGDFPDLATTLALKGAEIITRPSALLRTYDHWYAINFARAYDNHTFLIGVNSVGPDAGGNHYFGHSQIIAPNGWRLAQGRCAEEIVYADLSPEIMKSVYHGTTSPQLFDHLRDRNLEVYDVMKEGRSGFV